MALITPYIETNPKISTNDTIIENKQTSIVNYIGFINKLEGYKTRIKALHWAADAMNIHVRLDEFLDILSDYQDSVAEECMGIHGKISAESINGINIMIYEPNTILKDICASVEAFYTELGNCICYAGLRSETETFMHNINKYIYLFSLCKG